MTNSFPIFDTCDRLGRRGAGNRIELDNTAARRSSVVKVEDHMGTGRADRRLSQLQSAAASWPVARNIYGVGVGRGEEGSNIELSIGRNKHPGVSREVKTASRHRNTTLKEKQWRAGWVIDKVCSDVDARVDDHVVEASRIFGVKRKVAGSGNVVGTSKQRRPLGRIVDVAEWVSLPLEKLIGHSSTPPVSLDA